MLHYLPRLSILPLVCASALIVVPIMDASADDSSAGDNWQYAASVYLWGAGIKGETATGGEVDISFDSLIRNLNMAFMGAVEARKSQWSMLADVVYLNVGDDGAGRVPVTTESGVTLPLKVDTSVKVKGWVVSLLGGYNVRNTERLSVDVIAGARYIDS